MNSKQKFENFLESLKGKDQDNLIESVKEGFNIIFESIGDAFQKFVNNEIFIPIVKNQLKNNKFDGNEWIQVLKKMLHFSVKRNIIDGNSVKKMSNEIMPVAKYVEHLFKKAFSQLEESKDPEVIYKGLTNDIYEHLIQFIQKGIRT